MLHLPPTISFSVNEELDSVAMFPDKFIVGKARVKRKLTLNGEYLNHLIEQDHRLVKHILAKSSGFQSLRMALKTLSGIGVMHQLHKESQREPNLFGFSSFQSLTELLAA